MIDHAPMDSVTLWKADTPGYYWLVEASLDAHGNLSVCSGDATREWYAIVSADHVPQLRATLAGDDVRLAAMPVLDQLVARFGADGERGPFEDIKLFLNGHAIPWTAQSW